MSQASGARQRAGKVNSKTAPDSGVPKTVPETSETEYSEWDPQGKRRNQEQKKLATTAERNAANGTILEADKPWEKKKQSFRVRMFWSMNTSNAIEI